MTHRTCVQRDIQKLTLDISMNSIYLFYQSLLIQLVKYYI